jgi:hypothetical protein
MSTVKKINGKPLTYMWINSWQLGDCRKLFRHRAESRGVKPTPVELDDAIWLAIEKGEMPWPYQPEYQVN